MTSAAPEQPEASAVRRQVVQTANVSLVLVHGNAQVATRPSAHLASRARGSIASPSHAECISILAEWSGENQREIEHSQNNINSLEGLIKEGDERLARRAFWTKMGARAATVAAIALGLLGLKILAAVGGILAQIVGNDGELQSYLWGKAKLELVARIAPKKAEHQKLLDQRASLSKALKKIERKMFGQLAAPAPSQLPPGRRKSRRRRRTRRR